MTISTATADGLSTNHRPVVTATNIPEPQITAAAWLRGRAFADEDGNGMHASIVLPRHEQVATAAPIAAASEAPHRRPASPT